MKFASTFLYLLLSVTAYAQSFNQQSQIDLNNRISTIDFVEILNDNIDEALYYYNNNWKELRNKAIDKDYILSYQLLQTPLTDNNKIQLLLITTYATKEQYDKREEHFQELIKNSGGLKLLNDKKPDEFRKVAFFKEPVKHLN